jgi:hypothetical protein
MLLKYIKLKKKTSSIFKSLNNYFKDKSLLFLLVSNISFNFIKQTLKQSLKKNYGNLKRV